MVAESSAATLLVNGRVPCALLDHLAVEVLVRPRMDFRLGRRLLSTFAACGKPNPQARVEQSVQQVLVL